MYIETLNLPFEQIKTFNILDQSIKVTLELINEYVLCTLPTPCNNFSFYAHMHSCMRPVLRPQIQVQSSILSGGVAVAVSMSAVELPWEAMAIGFTAAAVSTVGVRYLKVYNLQMYCKHTHALTLVCEAAHLCHCLAADL